MPLSNIEILHQDDALLVINKPTLLLSVPGRAEDNRDCLVTRLQENGYPEARIVHLETNLRPALPDNEPRIDHQDGLLRINGLYRHGWLLAPALVEDALRQCFSPVTTC